MQQMHTFVRDEVLPSWFANALGKALSLLAEGVQLSKLDATHIQLAASANDGAAVLSVGGQWRWLEAALSVAHPGGAAGTYPVFVTAANNNIQSLPQPYTDDTNYAFAMTILPPGQTPVINAGVVDVYRHIGNVEWDGAQITRVDQLAPAPTTHAYRHAAGGADPLAPSDIGALPTANPVATGTLTVPTLSVTANASVGGTLTVSGQSSLSVAGGNAPADQLEALTVSTTLTPAANYNGAYGQAATLTIGPANGTTSNYGHASYSHTQFSGSGGVVSQLDALYARNEIAGASPTGTVTTSAGLYVDQPASVATGAPVVTVSNQYGVNVQNQAARPAGVTTLVSYGLYVANQVGAGTVWALYSAGGQSSHAGSFRFGDNTAPAYTVDVGGTLRASGAATFGSTLAVTGTSQFSSMVTVSVAAAATVGLWVGVAGDANARHYIRADGYLAWGPGNAAQDTSLQRAGVNSLQVGANATQAGGNIAVPLLTVVGAGNNIEFGHSNAGYHSALGAEASNGNPFIAFTAMAGTANNTYTTQAGRPGSVLRGDLAGGFQWNTVPAASTNAALTTTMSLSSAGVLTLYGTLQANSGTIILGSTLQTNLVSLFNSQTTDQGFTNPTIAGTASTGAAYPYLEIGNLVIASRWTGQPRDILLYTGTPATARLKVDRGGNVGIGGFGATVPPGLLTVGATNTANAAGGIYFGTDTTLYRSAASTLTTDGGLVVSGVLTANGGLIVGEAQNIVLGTVTGTKIGTANTQKLGFFNKAPVTQPGRAAGYANNSGLVLPASRTLPVAFTLNQLAQFVLQLVSDLGDSTGVGLVSSGF